MPKCSKCSKKAEYYLPDSWGRPEKYFCENHGMILLKTGEKNFLPKLKTK